MRWLALVILVGLSRDALADDDVPALEPGRIASEAFVGAALGIGGALGAGYTMYRVERYATDCWSWKHGCGMTGAFTGGLIGMAMLAPAGVYFVGSYGDQTGSLLATYSGAAAGTLVGIGAAMIENDYLLLALPGAVVGSIIGFNITRRYDRRERTSWMPVIDASSERIAAGVTGVF